MTSEFRPPSDKEVDTYGSMLAVSIFGVSELSTSLFVVQIVLVLYGLSGFLVTPKDRRKGRLRFIIISALMLVMCAIDIGFDVWRSFLLMYTGGPDGESYLRVSSVLSARYENWNRPIGDAFFFAAVALGDFLMLWRCLILWTDKRWVVLFPSLACVGSIASNIAYLASEAASNTGLKSQMQLAGAVLNVAMNIMITFLIVFRVMRARFRTAKAFPHQKPPRWYSEVTAIIVESAAPLAIFGIIFMALRGTVLSESGRRLQSGQVLRRGRLNIVTGFSQCLYNAFCTLSPQMIIVRVTRGKAWDGRVMEGTDEDENLSQPIQFVHSAKETTDSNISNSI
ncbi:hypothetical protein BKA70DRAFT_358608 [Coprinopsis sp. MPI-PUGE-AT-0042]|nr:hypothetical protein BKA70DRAFT_358608 [Coprinopsis sp. MPI-PUGE-AT-0042]